MRISAGRRQLRRVFKKWEHFGRRAFRPETTFVISFPKCGRTWLRLMLGHYLAHHHGIATSDYLMVGELRGHPLLPRLAIKHDDKPYKRRPDELNADKSLYRYDRVLFLCRDPRDVLISHYHALRHRATSYRYDGSLRDYVYEERGSLATIVAYYNIWARASSQPRAFLRLRYEDLLTDPHENLALALRFLGIEAIDEERLAASVTFAAFDNMRRLEVGDAFGSKTLRPADPADTSSYKTRKGIVGDHLSALEAPELDYVNSLVERELDPGFGYGSGRPAARRQRRQLG